jgi:hypothetical protein
MRMASAPVPPRCLRGLPFAAGTGALLSSSEFQASQPGHFPYHRGVSNPQAVQVNMVFSFAKDGFPFHSSRIDFSYASVV